jgi:hypothetical protein
MLVIEGSHGRDVGPVGSAGAALPFIFASLLSGGLVGAEGLIDVVVEFLLSLSGPWRALRAKIGTSSLRNRLRGCDAAEVAEMTLAVRFKFFSVVGPFIDLGGSVLMTISAAGLGSAGRDAGRWGVIEEDGGAGKFLP